MASQHTMSPENFQLGAHVVPRIWNGLWQLSGNAWGSAPSAKIRQQMATHAERGYTAFGEFDDGCDNTTSFTYYTRADLHNVCL